jgi:tetratricopeptide (TPR) repeat protein
MPRSFVVIFPATRRGLALDLAREFPDDRFNFVEIDHSPVVAWRLAELVDAASDLVILWSGELEASPQLPWLLSPDFLERLVNVNRMAVWVFRLDDAIPPLDLLAFSMGGIPDEGFLARTLRGRPPVRPSGDAFLGRSEWTPKFDQVFYSSTTGMLWLHGLAGIGKRSLARHQAERYDPNGHLTQRIALRPGMREVEIDLQLVANMRATTAAYRNELPVGPQDDPEAARAGLERHVKAASAKVAVWIFEDAHHLLRDNAAPNDVLLGLLEDLRQTAGVVEYRCMAVLTSTRKPRLPPELGEISVIGELGGLSQRDGVNLLRNRGADHVDEHVLRRCVLELGGHPLALEIAAPRLAEGQQGWERSRVRAATEVLASTSLSERAQSLLEALAVVDGPIPPERLAAYLGMREAAFRDALLEAVSYSLLEVGEDRYPRLHPLARDFFLQSFRQRDDQPARASVLADSMLEFLRELPEHGRLFVSCAMSAFRLLGLALRIQEAREIRANLLGPIFEAGVELYRQQRWSEALASFEAVISWYDQHVEAKLYQARCQARLGRVEEARELLRQLQRQAPDDRQVLRVAGRVEYIAGNWRGAINHYTRALEGGPAYPPLLQDLAQALVRIEEWERARDVLRRLVDAGAADAYTFSLLAEALEHTGQELEALQNARRASRYSPRNPHYLARVGHLSRRAGQLAEAGEAYERALRLEPGNQEVKLALAAVRQALQRQQAPAE